MTTQLQRTALYQNHLDAGARIVPFAGWEMPVQYTGVIDETRAVRDDWGVFDVSHMGQFELQGEDATEALNGIVSADWGATGIGRVAYALLLNDRGGVIDDIMGYHRAEGSWLIVANASRAEIDELHLRTNLPSGVFRRNRYADQVMLAVQGPEAASRLGELLSGDGLASGLAVLKGLDVAALGWRDFIEVEGAQDGIVFVARGGYTGCDGFEIMCGRATGTLLWQALMEAGCTPCGLAARDALRLEAALPLYGHELREEWTPYESGCGFAVKMDKGDFIGRDALVGAQKPAKRIRALRMNDKAIPRETYAVARDGGNVGEVTSGSFSPTLGAGIALAMVPASVALGETIDVVVRHAAHAAEVVKPPFVPNVRK